MRDFVIESEHTIIFPSEYFNGLFRASLLTGEANLIGIFPGEAQHAERLYQSVHKYKNCILFIPANGHQFIIYDIKTEQFNVVLDIEASPNIFKYNGSILINHYVYVFGGSSPEIIRVDMETFQIKRYDKWVKEIFRYGKIKDTPFFYHDICLVDNNLFLLTGHSNSIVEIDIQTEDIIVHQIGKKNSIFKTLAWDGSYFWLMDQTQNVIKVNIKEKSYEIIKTGNLFLENWFPFSVVVNNEIWFLSNINKYFLKVCQGSNSINKIEIATLKQEGKYGFLCAKKIKENEMVMFSVPNNILHIFVDGKNTMDIKLIWENVSEEYFSEYSKNGCYLEQRKLFGNLNDYINWISCSGKVDEWMIINHDIGGSIYNLTFADKEKI